MHVSHVQLPLLVGIKPVHLLALDLWPLPRSFHCSSADFTMTLATAWLEFYPGLQQNPLAILTSIAVILLLYYPSQWLYLYYFHPLASFPGHPAAAFSNRWLLSNYKGFPEREFEKLHEKYRASRFSLFLNSRRSC